METEPLTDQWLWNECTQLRCSDEEVVSAIIILMDIVIQ